MDEMNEIEAGKQARDCMNLIKDAIEKAMALNHAIDACCVDGGIIGTGQSDFTKDSTEYNMRVKGKGFSLIDVPGIEGDESKYMGIIRKALEKAHIVFYVNGSGKKIESETAQRIRDYLQHDSSVYALINVHCQPMKNRDIEVDGRYSDNLTYAYSEASRVSEQSKEQLVSILGEHYKDSKCLNGLLAFYALAIDSETGKTTVVPDIKAKKALRREQIRYYNDCDKSKDRMLELSQINGVKNIIDYYTEHYEDTIVSENVKKLRRLVVNTTEETQELRDSINQKLSDYERAYNDSYGQYCEAKDIYVNNMLNIGYTIADGCLEGTRDRIYSLIDYSEGKVKPEKIEAIVREDESEINERASKALSEKGAQYNEEFKASIAKVQANLLEDIDRVNKNFAFNIKSRASKYRLKHVMDPMKFDAKDFGKSLLKVGGFAAVGAGVGTLILPVIGTIIGAAIGALAGVFASIIGFFMSRETRIRKAKEKVDKILGGIRRQIGEDIRSHIGSSELVASADEVVNQQKKFADEQKASFNIVRSVLDNVIAKLNAKVESIDGGEYGAID